MEHSPARFFQEATGNSQQWDLIILNQPVQGLQLFRRLWAGAEYRICADGGANRLYDMFTGSLGDSRAEFIPSAVHGDLDSLRNNVRDYYAARGAEVTLDQDQYSTDFGKAMRKVLARPSTSHIRDIVILGSLSGRVDHGLGVLHELLRETERVPGTRLWLFSETNISFILRKGMNAIQLPLSNGFFTRNVGIIPIYGPAAISTEGLEWDVKNWQTKMGHQVSTSNHVVADTIRVETSESILFTVERSDEFAVVARSLP